MWEEGGAKRTNGDMAKLLVWGPEVLGRWSKGVEGFTRGNNNEANIEMSLHFLVIKWCVLNSMCCSNTLEAAFVYTRLCPVAPANTRQPQRITVLSGHEVPAGVSEGDNGEMSGGVCRGVSEGVIGGMSGGVS